MRTRPRRGPEALTSFAWKHIHLPLTVSQASAGSSHWAAEAGEKRLGCRPPGPSPGVGVSFQVALSLSSPQSTAKERRGKKGERERKERMKREEKSSEPNKLEHISL